MISIVICSRKINIDTSLLNNIRSSIGSDYEIIVIDNSQNKYSIFEAYNLGIKQSQGNYWCFMHDDILFHSKDWGKVIENIFRQDSKIGLIGVSGAKIKTKMPSAWWNCPKEFRVINIIQRLNFGKVEHWEEGWEVDKIEEVVTIDGVFMAARRLVDFRFSDKLRGFHNYDLNLSFEYLMHNYKIVITKEILLEHFSLGTLNSSWYHSTLLLHNLYSKILPLKTNIPSHFNSKIIEFDNGSKFLIDSGGNFNKLDSIKIWIKLIKLKPISKFHFKFVKLLFK